MVEGVSCLYFNFVAFEVFPLKRLVQGGHVPVQTEPVVYSNGNIGLEKCP